ncbi:MAG: hypothetical protein VZS44_04575 [Bacilli bacterium]|nr:hypothetical protein [Bacilli bacterium]
MNNKKIIFICITIVLIIAVIFLSLSNNNTNKNQSNQIINKKATIKSIKFDDKKINIYFFWGDGCPHCEEEYEFWDSIIKEYKDKINCIYGMEVWKNKKNAKSLKEFADFKKEKVKGVPYTIIGDKTFIGFDKSMKKQMKKKIDELYEAGNNYDIYKEITKETNDEKKDK